MPHTDRRRGPARDRWGKVAAARYRGRARNRRARRSQSSHDAGPALGSLPCPPASDHATAATQEAQCARSQGWNDAATRACLRADRPVRGCSGLSRGGGDRTDWEGRSGPKPHVVLKKMISAAPIIFDRELVRARQRRAARLAASNFLVDRAAEDLCDRLAAVLRRFEYAVDVGTPNDAVRRALAASGKVGTIIAVDRSPAALHGGAAAEGTRLVVAADEEALPFRDASLDLVVSLLAFQFVNDLPGT